MQEHRNGFKVFEWNPSTAYAIGLLTADGNLSPDGRHFEFCSKDLENVVHFRKCLQLKTRISLKGRGTKPYRTYYRTQFGNVKLYRFLLGLGLRPRKSRTLESVAIPKEFFADFLRGLWDGDGGFSTFKHPESRRLQWKARFSSGSRVFLDKLRGLIGTNYGLSAKLYQTGRVYQLAYHKDQGSHLLKIMYDRPGDVVCLTRKREQALRLLNA